MQTYRHSLALLTDLYQLTMACGYWKAGLAEREAVFHLTFRRHPFGGRFAVACGLAAAIEFLRELRFTDDDVAYLATLRGADGRSLFDAAFLGRLRDFEFACDVDAIPEGTFVFAREPLLRVRGPLWQSQIVETPLLNLLNFQTLIATKAARIRQIVGDQSLLEFGLRRAQGIDGGLAASRAAYIGGCTATSNVLAGKLFGIPVRGTHAHSWVTAFADERQAFLAYAEAMPGNCVFLVDTYDTLQGVQNAIRAARRLRDAGGELLGIRLDSGDLAELSRRAREMLDAAGFPRAAIVATGDLDEHRIKELLSRGARIDVWGAGTRLATAYDQPALDGVYKLAAMRDEAGCWEYRLKLSEQEAKSSDPGVLQVRRFHRADERFAADVIYDELTGLPPQPTAILLDTGQPLAIAEPARHEELLVPVFRSGRSVYLPVTAADARQRTIAQCASCDAVVLRLHDAEAYPVGLEQGLHRRRAELVAAARAGAHREFRAAAEP